MNFIFAIPVAAIIALSTTGCASVGGVGTPINWDNARKVRGGMTTEEVTQLMGKPYAVSAKPDGTQVWSWVYANAWTGGSSSAALPFDVDGKAKGGFNIPASFK